MLYYRTTRPDSNKIDYLYAQCEVIQSHLQTLKVCNPENVSNYCKDVVNELNNLHRAVEIYLMEDRPE